MRTKKPPKPGTVIVIDAHKDKFIFIGVNSIGQWIVETLGDPEKICILEPVRIR